MLWTVRHQDVNKLNKVAAEAEEHEADRRALNTAYSNKNKKRRPDRQRNNSGDRKFVIKAKKAKLSSSGNNTKCKLLRLLSCIETLMFRQWGKLLWNDSSLYVHIPCRSQRACLSLLTPERQGFQKRTQGQTSWWSVKWKHFAPALWHTGCTQRWMTPSCLLVFLHAD